MSIQQKHRRNFPPFATHERDAKTFPSPILEPEYADEIFAIAELCSSPIFREEKIKHNSLKKAPALVNQV